MPIGLILGPLTTTLGAIYPAYLTYKSVRQKNIKNYEVHLKYWIVFASFFALTTVTDFLFSWLPLYSLAKFVLQAALVTRSGTLVAYDSFIEPYLEQNEPAIDSFIARAQSNSIPQIKAFLVRLPEICGTLTRQSIVLTSQFLDTYHQAPMITAPTDSQVRNVKKVATKRSARNRNDFYRGEDDEMIRVRETHRHTEVDGYASGRRSRRLISRNVRYIEDENEEDEYNEFA